MTMTDYNDGKWHGWNGGECPVDPASEVEWVWHDPAHNTAGKSEGLAGRAAWRSHVLKFRVTKPAPPKPRELWATSQILHETREKAEAFRAQLIAENPGMDFPPIVRLVVTPE